MLSVTEGILSAIYVLAQVLEFGLEDKRWLSRFSWNIFYCLHNDRPLQREHFVDKIQNLDFAQPTPTLDNIAMNKSFLGSAAIACGITLTAAVGHLLDSSIGWQMALQLLVIMLAAAGVDSIQTKHRLFIEPMILPILYVGLYLRLLAGLTTFALWFPMLALGGVLFWHLLHAEAAEWPTTVRPPWPVLMHAHLLSLGLITFLWLTLPIFLAVLAGAAVFFLLCARLFAPLCSVNTAALYAAAVAVASIPFSAAVGSWPITPLQTGLVMTLGFYLTSSFFIEHLKGQFRPFNFVQYVLIAFGGLILVSLIG